MKTVTIPHYCNLSGCYNVATVHGKDERGHPVNACSAEHLRAEIAHRHNIYLPHDPIEWQGADSGLAHKFAG